jgi:O-antigen ligase
MEERQVTCVKMAERISPSLIVSILVSLVGLFLGVAISLLNPIYAFIIAGALIVAIMVVLRLDELILTLIVAIQILVESYLGYAVYQISLLMGLVLLVACYFGRSAKRPWTEPRWLWLWLMFLAWNIVPTLKGGSFSLTNSIGYYLEVVVSSLIGFWLGNLIARDIVSIRRLLQLLSLLAVFFAVHTIIQATTGVFLFESARAKANLLQASNFQIGGSVSRASSFFGNPNGDGGFMATCLFLPLGLFVGSKHLWARIIYLGEILLILTALMFTYSTGSWMAAIVGIFVFIFLAGRLHYSLLLSLLIVGVGVLAVVLFPAQINAQLTHARDQGDLSLHLATWQTAARVTEAYPVFGVGLGNYAYLTRSQPYRVPAQTKPLAEPDNSYLQWGAIAGIPAMLMFLLLLTLIFWNGWRNWLIVDSRYRCLFAGGICALIALSIDSLTVDGWTSPGYIVWLIAGIIASPLVGRCLSSQSASSAVETDYVQLGASWMDEARQCA